MDPVPSCSYFTVTNIHITNECAKRRSLCIVLLLLVRDLCLKLGAVVFTEDFNTGAERELPRRGADDQRRISPREAAFIFANVPWPTSGVTPLWGFGTEPHGNKWPECGGFVLLHETQNQWLVMRHGSFNVVPASIGLKSMAQQAVPRIRWPQAKKGYVPLPNLSPGDTGNTYHRVLE